MTVYRDADGEVIDEPLLADPYCYVCRVRKIPGNRIRVCSVACSNRAAERRHAGKPASDPGWRRRRRPAPLAKAQAAIAAQLRRELRAGAPLENTDGLQLVLDELRIYRRKHNQRTRKA